MKSWDEERFYNEEDTKDLLSKVEKDAAKILDAAKIIEDAKKFAEQLFEDTKEPHKSFISLEEAETKRLQEVLHNSIGSSTETAPKNKTNKPSWSIFPFDEAEEVRKVFEWGALPKNYKAPFTYRKGSGVPEKDLWDATFRHLLAIQRGEDHASDSLLLHWAHIAANALMAITTYNKSKTIVK